MKTLKPCKIVCLPTDKKSVIYKTDRLYYYTESRENGIGGCINQHLYLISDEIIKELDYCINKNNRVVKALKDYRDFEPLVKIIASTDSSLKLPQIDNQLIQAYVKSNGTLNEVLVEYENIYEKTNSHVSQTSGEPDLIETILILNDDNTIIWSLKEDKMYSKEQVLKFLVFYSGMERDKVERQFDKYFNPLT